MSTVNDRLTGILLGTAVGDALGLHAEGLTPQRRRRLFPGPWRYRFLFGRGMVSDDTEHAFFVSQSLLEHSTDAKAFQRSLAWHLRWWFLGLPAGIGMATAKACIKLCLGFPPTRSGVFSAGNGPAMRSPIIGGYFCDDQESLECFVQASTKITHTDPKAQIRALAIARLTAWAMNHDIVVQPTIEEIESLLSIPDEPEWNQLLCEVKA